MTVAMAWNTSSGQLDWAAIWSTRWKMRSVCCCSNSAATIRSFSRITPSTLIFAVSALSAYTYDTHTHGVRLDGILISLCTTLKRRTNSKLLCNFSPHSLNEISLLALHHCQSLTWHLGVDLAIVVWHTHTHVYGYAILHLHCHHRHHPMLNAMQLLTRSVCWTKFPCFGLMLNGMLETIL